MENNKEKIINKAIDDNELDAVAGGGCWFGAKDEAPDGHDIGCTFSFSWYASWSEYNYKKGICEHCGGKLGSEQTVSSSKYKVCTQCGWDAHNDWD